MDLAIEKVMILNDYILLEVFLFSAKKLNLEANENR